MSKFHEMTGHIGEHVLKPTANYMKLKLIGTLPPCEACAKAKIRQRNIPKKKMKKLPTSNLKGIPATGGEGEMMVTP